MRAGELRHTVYADEPISASDGEGGEVINWVPRLKFKAAVEPISGREALRSNQIVASMDTRITLRWSVEAAAIKPNWRLRHDGVIYNIARPPAEKALGRREIEIMVSSGLNQG